jgi:hypothetical protein
MLAVWLPPRWRRSASAVQAVFEMLDDPGRWRQGLDNLLAGWLVGAPDEVAGWTRRETGSYGFDMWSRAARAVTADYGQYGSPCARLRNSTRNLTCCTCTPSRAPPGSSPASKSSRPRIRGFWPGS